MSAPRLDLLTIGNAITDIFAKVDDEFLTEHGLDKSIMHLVDGERSEYLYNAMPEDKTERSGGSTANTAVGVAALGGNAAFVGKVANDEVGRFYTKDMQKEGVEFTTRPLEHGAASGRSMILVTPDGERTMNTYLGACHDLTQADIIQDQIGDAAVTFMEGYLWDPEEAKRAFVLAAQFAHKKERAAAISLSDPFCVDRFRDEFRDLVKSKTCDYVFANAEELKSLYQTDDMATAVRQIAQEAELAVVTMGAEGAMAIHNGEIVSVPAAPVDEVVDVTGAGDLFAAGFFMGHTRSAPLEKSLELGCLCASEVISHVGARPNVNLKELAKKHGLDFS